MSGPAVLAAGVLVVLEVVDAVAVEAAVAEVFVVVVAVLDVAADVIQPNVSAFPRTCGSSMIFYSRTFSNRNCTQTVFPRCELSCEV